MVSKIRYTIFSTLVFGLFFLSTGNCQEEDSIFAANKSLNYILQAKSQFNNEQLDNVRTTFNDFFKKAAAHPRQYPADDWVDTCYQFAISIYRSGRYEFLTEVFAPLLKLEVEVEDNKYYEELGKLTNIMALGYKNQGALAESIPVYLKALEYFKLCNDIEARILPEFYLNLGNALRTLGDPGQADTYYSESLRLINKQLEESSDESPTNSYFIRRKATVLNSIGLNLQGLGKNSEALEMFSNSYAIANIYDPLKLPLLDNNIGISLRAIGNRDSAIHHFKRAVEAFNSPDSYNRNWFKFSLNYSDILINKEELDKARQLIISTIANGKGIVDVTDTQIADAYFQLGTIHSEKEEYSSAIQNIDYGLSLLTGIDLPGDSEQQIPKITLANSPGKVIEGIKFRARIIHDWADKNNESSKYFEALENYELAEICIDSLRVIIEDEQSKINLSRLAKETYSEKLDLLWNVKQYAPEDEVAINAFETIEKGKAAGIWNIMQLSQDKNQTLPDEILNLEKSLRNDIADFENRIINIDLTSSTEADSLQNLKFLKERELDSLTNYINTNFSEFRKGKFQNRTFSTDELKDLLSSNQVMIQYFFSDKLLHQILLTRDSIVYTAIPDVDSLRLQIREFSKMLKLNQYDYSQNDVELYQALAWDLYRKLISPFQELINGKEIIILPDEFLSLIPFETLVSSEIMMADSDFRDLKYFIRDNQISYSYNGSLWGFRKNTAKTLKKSVFAFAPSYGVKGMDTSSVWSQLEEFLPKLDGTLEEVKLIRRKYRSETFTRNKATEKRFKAKAAEYSILHLAMHSSMDKSQPDNTFLVFTPFADKKEDGKLYANEIQNMDLGSSLTILSSCNSGTGELIAGEGVLSLTRTFLIAGTSSVIMTLWSVDDQTSKELIDMLYEEMSYGMSIAKALRSAKLNFIDQSSKLTSHPFFWSGFIQLGRDTNIIIQKKNRRWYWFGGGLILLGIFIILTIRNTKSRS